MFPWRCKQCQKLHYTTTFESVPTECCVIKPEFERIARVCLLIPCPEGQTPVHISGYSPNLNTNGGKKWVLACGVETLPPYITTFVGAATCQKCLENAPRSLPEIGVVGESVVPNPPEDVVLPEDFEIVLESDEPPNPFAKEPNS